ncbi:MAG: FeoB-associated Cys-rich membrane protein [Clostridiales bacterium]|nr:FeoB-associated Cys-rich membrane protein [Clostridiales bacterium]
MPTVIVTLAIAAYSFWVIRRRVREIKAGKYCSCSDCSGNCAGCHGKSE